MMNRKIVWLASWYPNKLSPFNGDFIKRHAEAISLYADVHVIYVVRDPNGKLTKNIFKEETVNGKLSETILYYYNPQFFFSLLSKFFSERKYRRFYKSALKEYIDKNGKPDIIHVHVGMKAGIIALWAKKKWKIKYVVTEHWSGFLKEATEKFSDLPFYLRMFWRKIMFHATGCSAVSQYLCQAIQKHFSFVSCKVIPNVVNTNIFYYSNDFQKIDPVFIHISGLDKLKNPEAILKAFQIVLKSFPQATLKIFGSQRKDILELSNTLKLQDNVSFYPEVSQLLLAEQIKKSDALILYSEYETFGCVIIEANACGVPVIVSDIPVFHETVKDGENGYFVKLDDPSALADNMIKVINKRSQFKNKSIALDTDTNYGYKKVGQQFIDWYNQVL